VAQHLELGTQKTQQLGYRKIVSLLFMTIGNRKWQFFGKFSNGKQFCLECFALFKIRRHKLIAGVQILSTHIGMIIFVKESCAGF
jgi:hypothetical protein